MIDRTLGTLSLSAASAVLACLILATSAIAQEKHVRPADTSLAAHLEHLLKHCWKATFTVAFPRLRPHAGNHLHEPDPSLALTDRQLVQLICAFRITVPVAPFAVNSALSRMRL